MIDEQMIKVKKKKKQFLILVPVTIFIMREISCTQKEIRIFLASRGTKERKEIRSPFSEKTGKG